MKFWSWPLPNCVPWERPSEGSAILGIYLKGELNQRVCAVEEGEVVFINKSLSHPPFVTIQGSKGDKVSYWGVWATGIKVGDRVARSSVLGALHGLKGYPVQNRECLLLQVKTQDDMPIFCLTQIQGAWAQVTPRFHKDYQKPPSDLDGKKKAIDRMMGNPIWFTYLDFKGSKIEDHGFYETANIEHQYVDPCRERITPSQPRNNTDFRVWIEGGTWEDLSKEEYAEEPPGRWTDFNKWNWVAVMDLESGGATLEEALLDMAGHLDVIVDGKGEYKDTTPICDFRDEKGLSEEEWEAFPFKCEDDGQGFCKKCGHLIKPYDETDEEEGTGKYSD